MLDVMDVAPNPVLLVDITNRADDTFQESDEVKGGDVAFVHVVTVNARHDDPAVVVLFGTDRAEVNIHNIPLHMSPELDQTTSRCQLFRAPARGEQGKQRLGESIRVMGHTRPTIQMT